MGDIKDKVKSLFKTIPTKNYSKPIRISNVYGGQKKPRKPKMKKQSEDKIIIVVEYRVIKDIKNLLTNNRSDNSQFFSAYNFCFLMATLSRTRMFFHKEFSINSLCNYDSLSGISSTEPLAI